MDLKAGERGTSQGPAGAHSSILADCHETGTVQWTSLNEARLLPTSDQHPSKPWNRGPYMEPYLGPRRKKQNLESFQLAAYSLLRQTTTPWAELGSWALYRLYM